MKKLLSILAAISMSATAASNVVACGSSNSSKDDTDKTLIISSNGIKVTSDEMLDQMLKKGDWTKVFGDQGTAIKNFMNYFAEAFMKNISDKTPDLSKNALAASYTNDDTFKTISNSWKTRTSNANDSWNKTIEDAKSSDGKKWESKLFDTLKDKYGEDIYKNGKTVKAKSYTDYETQFKSDAILTGAGSSDSKTVFSDLSDDIYSWAKTPSNTTVDSVIGNLKSSLFGKKYDVNGITIDFSSAKTSGALLDQMKNLLNVINKAKDTSKGTESDLLNFVVSMYNISGGLNPQAQSSFNVASINWATKDNVKDKIKDVDAASNDLIKRMDSNYKADFGDGTKLDNPASSSNLMINPDYNYTKWINYIPDDTQSDTNGAQIAGLYSNTQRFAANDYYNIEKPVAVSEIVVSPTQSSTVDYSQQITNSGYVGTDIKAADQLYNFIGNFINNTIPGNFTNAKTNDVITGTPNYTWDDLMSNISGDWDKNVNPDGQSWDSTFKGKVKFNAHSNLLTVNSSTSDYSNLLKYSVYDYLTNGASEYSWNKNDAKPLTGETNIDVIKQANPNPVDISQDLYTSEFNVLTNFIQSMNRTANKDAKKMYQVVNSKQGIISFMDSDGIHFVRIEGYNLLNNKEKLVNDQNALSTKNFSDSKNGDAAKANYNAAETIKSALASDNDVTKNSAVMVSSDYIDNDQDTSQSSLVGVKYSDLNRGFGNQYLRFLANSSIPKSVGYSSPKYSYDLNDLLKSYVNGDITTDNVLKNSAMVMMAWNYAKMILNKSDDIDMFNWVVDGSSLKDQLHNTSWTEDTKSRFINDYQKYITSSILSKYSDSSRLIKANRAFANGLETADNDIVDTTWKDSSKAMNDLHPALRWSDVISGTDSANSYDNEVKGLTASGMWVPYKGANDPSPSPSNKSEMFKYNVQMDQFITNEYALEGDEE